MPRQRDRRDMSFDVLLFLVYFGWSFVLFVLGMSWPMPVVTEAAVTGALVPVLVGLSVWHRRHVGWRWPGVSPWQALAAVGALLLGAALLCLLWISCSPFEPRSLPFFLMGAGIVTWHVLEAFRVVASSERQFLGEEEAADAEQVKQDKMQTGRRRRLLVRGAGVLLMVLGCIGFLGGAYAMEARPKWLSGDVELPLGALSGVAVDGQGRIYCGSPFYGRVQVYDADGRFLRGWFVDAGGGIFRLRMGPGGTLEVATTRKDSYFRFDSDGNILERKTDVPDYFDEFGKEGERRCRDAMGNTYTIRSALLFPHIVRTAPDGTSATVVSVPTWEWFLMGPLPAWLIAALGMILQMGTSKQFRERLSRFFGRKREANHPAGAGAGEGPG